MGRIRTKNKGLPKRLYLRRDGYYYRHNDNSEIKVAPENQREKAIREWAKLRIASGELRPEFALAKSVLDDWERIAIATCFEELPAWAITLYRKAANASKRRKIGFDLSSDDFVSLVKESTGRCALSGIVFNIGKVIGVGRASRRPFAPSLDRIESRLGYSKDNVRLVCVAANYAMNFWGEEILYCIAEGMMKKRNGSLLCESHSQFAESGTDTKEPNPA